MNRKTLRWMAALVLASNLTVATPGTFMAGTPGNSAPTTTPIKHVVVIFQENVSFNHYLQLIRMRPTRTESRNSMPAAAFGFRHLR